MKYCGDNDYGVNGLIEDISKSDYCQYTFRMQIYNSSEAIKVLRDIKIEFVSNEKSIITKPSNSDSGTKSAGVYKIKR